MFVPIKRWSGKCIHILQDGYCLRSFTSGCRIMHSHYQEKRQNKAYCELVWCCPCEVEYFHLIKLVVVRLSESKREQFGIRERKGFFAFPRFPLLIARPRKSRFLLHLLLWWFSRVTNRILLWDRRALGHAAPKVGGPQDQPFRAKIPNANLASTALCSN